MYKELECTDAEHDRPIRWEKRFTNWEHFERCRDQKAIYCPVCGDGQNVKVVVSQTAPPRFKGSGFYSTDYGNG